MSNIQFDYNNSKFINKEDKYGNDEMFESWSDNNLFFPIASKLVTPLYDLGLTPNVVTILSTIFTFLSMYYLNINKRVHASLSYLFGYILDCVDGKMARKYSLGSDVGMALDCVSDNVSNLSLFFYILITRPNANLKKMSLTIIIIMTMLLSLSYGLNEAISSMNETGSDNFYIRRIKQLENKGCGYEKGLFNLFLFITKSSYHTYKLFFPIYDEQKILKWLKILKHFGPGNYCLFMGLLLLVI
jgi:hypothetical protein